MSKGAASELNVVKLDARDAYDTRATVDREGGRDVAMDDHSLRRIPATWRWSFVGATFTSFGLSTAMIYPLSGALFTQTYGALSALLGGLITTVYTLAACLYIVRHVINEGINADLLSRSTFGFMGSAFIAILYALVCSFYFAAEGSVMAHALHEAIPSVPYWGWAVLTSASFILIGIFGMVLLSKVQWITMILYFMGLAVAFWALVQGWSDRVQLTELGDWLSLNPSGVEFSIWTVLASTSGYIGVLGAILAVFHMDVARFIRREDRGFGGAIYILVNVTFPVLIMYMIGIQMLAASGQPDPGVTLVRLIGPLGLIITLVTQVRINLLNLYGGTLGLANFFSRIFGFVPGRHFWVVPFLILATIIILTPFRENFGLISVYISVFLCAWVSTLIGERIFVRRYRKLPSWSEVRRSYLADYNLVGMLSMWVTVVIGCVMATGWLGREAHALAVPVAIVVPLFAPALVAKLLGEERLLRSYVGRDVVSPPEDQEELTCIVCNNEYHRSDFALCPHHGNGWICSYCCLSEQECGTICRKGSEVSISSVVLEPEAKA